MENELKEINLQDLIQLILKRWKIIVFLPIICSIITYVVTVNYIEPIYEAKTSLFIGKEQNQIGSISFSDLQVNNQLIIDYRELIKSRMVVDEVIKSTGINMTIDTFRECLSINTIKDSRLFTISFQNTDPYLSATIANEIAKVLVTKAAPIVQVENIRVIDIALVPQKPIKPSKLINTVLAGILSLMIALFITFLVEFLNNTIKTEEDVENHLGLVVIGVIPKFKGGE